MFVLVPGDNLVDSCTAICPSEVRGCDRMLYRLSSRNPEAGWTLVKETVACMDLSPGTLRILGSNGTVVVLQNPEILLGPEGRFWSPEAALDPEIAFRTQRLSEDPEVDGEPGDPEVVVGPGGYKEPGGLPFPGETTIGTCWDFALYRSETCHYRVPVLHVAFCRKPLSDLGVVLTSILRLIRPIHALSLIPIVIVAPCTNSEFEYSTLRLRKSLEIFYLSFLPGVKDRSRGRSRSFVLEVSQYSCLWGPDIFMALGLYRGYSTLRLRKSLEIFYLSFLPGVKDRSRGRSRSFVVGVGVETSSCGCMETSVLPGNKSIWPTGVVPSQHAYSGQDTASLFLSSSLVWAVFEPGEGSAFLRTLCSDIVVTSVLHPWDFIARVESGSEVSHSQRFMMSFNDASKPFSAPTWARSLGNLEKHVALASFRRGGAAVFPALGQGSFRGTTPTELDEKSSFDSPAYVTYQSCEPDRKVLCAASEPFIFSMGRSYEPGRIVKTRDQLDPRNVEDGFEVVTWSRGEPNIIEGRFQAGTGSRQGPGTVEVILEEWSWSQQEPKTVEV
ncbi:hypothetical protein DY000_02040227 [Brassica cretica]|uniref:Uncharacterized protein n=1 Tax=Brassica cretica TaxID=69181 RepID=A0ABQ7B5J9_BRACR|nr:hypothetical protein DY000_02040227 [Brassica cretica]